MPTSGPDALADCPRRRPSAQLDGAAHGAFVDAFRAAAERLRLGGTAVEFPLYAFPPAAPFVGGCRDLSLAGVHLRDASAAATKHIKRMIEVMS